MFYCPCLGQATCHSWRKKRRSTKRYRRDCQVICHAPVLLAPRRPRSENNNTHFSSLLSSSVFLCKILDKAWVIAMWEKSYWKYSVCRSQMAPWINAPGCYWGGSGANPVWSGSNLAISLPVGIEVYVNGRIQLCAKPLLDISKDLWLELYHCKWGHSPRWTQEPAATGTTCSPRWWVLKEQESCTCINIHKWRKTQQLALHLSLISAYQPWKSSIYFF